MRLTSHLNLPIAIVQAAQRDLEYAEAIAARFLEGSAIGPERDAAEEKHAVAVAAIGVHCYCACLAPEDWPDLREHRVRVSKSTDDAVPPSPANLSQRCACGHATTLLQGV